MQATARRLSVVSATSCARRRLIRVVRRLRTSLVKERLSKILILLGVTGALACSGYFILYRPYVALPRQDQAFLASHPNRDAVVQRFGRPAEELQPGQRFQMTGWHPLPDRVASHSALSFVRRYGSKLYLYFDAQGQMEFFLISRS